MKRLCVVLLLMLGLSLAGGTAAASGGESHKYVGAKKCKSCHKKEAIGNQYGKWSESKHATAFETLASDKAKEWAADAGVSNPQTDEKCVKCHVTAYGVAAELLSDRFDVKAGVQCEACHGAGKDYRKKKVMVDREKAEAKGLRPKNEMEKACTACHNDESPAWDAKRYSLADGSTAGFDYDAAKKKIAHPVPEGYDAMAESGAD